MIAVTPVVPVVSVVTGVSVGTGVSVVTGVVVIGGGVVTVSGHDDLARPSQGIPVSHSSVVTTGFLPKKSKKTFYLVLMI